MGAGTALAQWEQTPLEEVCLSTLESVFKHKQADRALHLLNCKIRIKIDSHYTLPIHNSIFRSASYLDFFAAIPHEPGLSVILPPDDTPPPSCWNFMLDFCYPQCLFNCKHGNLDFVQIMQLATSVAWTLSIFGSSSSRRTNSTTMLRCSQQVPRPQIPRSFLQNTSTSSFPGCSTAYRPSVIQVYICAQVVIML